MHELCTITEVIRLARFSQADALNVWTAYDGRAIRARKNQIIYEQLDPVDEVYLLLEGLVRLGIVDHQSRRQSTLFLRAPALFGSRDVLAGVGHAQDFSQAVLPSKMVCWPAEVFQNNIKLNHSLYQLVTNDLAVQYARCVRHLDFSALKLEERLLWLLSELQSWTSPPLCREHLATLLGAERKSVGRSLTRVSEYVHELENGGFQVDQQTMEAFGSKEYLSLFHSLPSDTADIFGSEQ